MQQNYFELAKDWQIYQVKISSLLLWHFVVGSVLEDSARFVLSETAPLFEEESSHRDAEFRQARESDPQGIRSRTRRPVLYVHHLPCR